MSSDMNQVRYLLQSSADINSELPEDKQNIVDDIYVCIDNSECKERLKPKLVKLLNELFLYSKTTPPGSVLWNLRHKLLADVALNEYDYFVGTYHNDEFTLLSRPGEGSDVLKLIVESPIFGGIKRKYLEQIASLNVSYVIPVYIADEGREVEIFENAKPLEDIIQKDSYSSGKELKHESKVAWFIVIAIVAIILSMVVKRRS